jgi:hypothetical protein
VRINLNTAILENNLKVTHGIEKLNIELPDDSKITILGMYPK